MARKFLVSLDLNKNELLNARIQNLSSNPSSPVAGQIYFNTVDAELRVYDGSQWVGSGSIQYGLLADRPAASKAGLVYATTDTKVLYLDEGSSWTQIGIGADTTDSLSNKTFVGTTYFTDGVTVANEGEIEVLPTSHVFNVQANNGDLNLKTMANGASVYVISDSGDIVLAADGDSYIGSISTNNRIATIGDLEGSNVQSVEGTANEIEVSYTGQEAGTGEITIGLPNNVEISTSLEVANSVTIAKDGNNNTTITSNQNIILGAGPANDIYIGSAANDYNIVATRGATETLTNKTLDDPKITGAAAFKDGSDNTYLEVYQSGTGTARIEASDDLALRAENDVILYPTNGKAYINWGNDSTNSNPDREIATIGTSQEFTNKTLGSGTILNSDLDANEFTITNLKAPQNGSDAATKSYVDAVSEGLHIHQAASVYVASNVNIATALEAGETIDGVTLTAGMRVLVNGQTTQSENGIYKIETSGAPSRALDFDTALEVASGDFIFVSLGDNYANTGWVQTLSPATIGTDAISFTQFSGAGTYSAGDGLDLDGTEFSVNLNETGDGSGLQKSGSGLSVKLTATSGLETTNTGLQVNAGAGFDLSTGELQFASGYGVRKFAQSIGDNSATTFTVTHNLDTKDVTVQIFENGSSHAQVEADVEHTTVSAVTIKFAVAPSTDEYRVVVVG
jgi:hypothetical protein